MGSLTAAAAVLMLALALGVKSWPTDSDCLALARTDAGWICGTLHGTGSVQYASFRGVPYARPPLGELRFMELQPPEPWNDLYDASMEGPVCPQTDVFYGRLMQPQAMSEDCIHANIHVPLAALPPTSQGRLARQLQYSYEEELDEFDEDETGLPIMVFIHGGGFAFGSGDSDIHGPEYLVSKEVIVITFNYRLGPLGFLSLNNSRIPGNAGLRDMVTLLGWVRRNARRFGGDPSQITLAGQSAGAAAAHLLSLSPAAQGLFSKVILMSGTAVHSFYTTSPTYAQYVAGQFLALLGINYTEAHNIHRQLVEMPLKRIMEANAILLNQIGLTAFVPVVESPHAGVTTILDDDPEKLIAIGRGADIPAMFGFTKHECETFLPRFEEINILDRVKENPLLMLSPNLLYKNSIEENMELAEEVEKRYFNGTLTMDGYIELCSETYFQYPAIKVAKMRGERGGLVFLYEFSYVGENDPLQLRHRGAAHVTDLSYLFRINSVEPPRPIFPLLSRDDHMKDWINTLFTNFMKCSNPTCTEYEDWRWPPVQRDLVYENIEIPKMFKSMRPTQHQREMIRFFDQLSAGPRATRRKCAV